METQIEEYGNNYAVFSISGKIDAITSPALQKALEELINKGVTRLIIDVTRVSYISSAGLRVLLITAKKLLPSGTCCIVGPNSDVQETLTAVGFNLILTIYDQLKTAKKELLEVAP